MLLFFSEIRKIIKKLKKCCFQFTGFPKENTFTNNNYFLINKKYELRLVASDNLNENYTTIVIHVNDVNDNPPVFDRPTYETQITEEDDRMLPKRVLQVKTKKNSAIYNA